MDLGGDGADHRPDGEAYNRRFSDDGPTGPTGFFSCPGLAQSM
jgi:hypothetical protein